MLMNKISKNSQKILAPKQPTITFDFLFEKLFINFATAKKKNVEKSVMTPLNLRSINRQLKTYL